MKSKQISKKLTLKKQTIINLEGVHQDAIFGGAVPPTSYINCLPTRCATVCGNTCCGTIDVCSC